LPFPQFGGIITANHIQPPHAVLLGQSGGFVLYLINFEIKIIMATLPITKRGAEILKAELHKLKTIERPSVISAISEARAQGDLSENAEYDAAKDRQGFIEGRIIELEGKLSVAQVIDPTELNAGGRVVFGTTVDLESEETGAKVTYQIVGEDEADIKYGLVNISSPIARALIGKAEGDIAEVQAPGGVKSYEIVNVRYI
jgi:transcription elongation factor GreA